MFQRAFFMLYRELDLDHLFRLDEPSFIQFLLKAGARGAADDLLQGLFGPARRLYKRLTQFSSYQQKELYEQLARRPYPWLVSCAEQLANLASRELSRRIAPHQVLIDAPPMHLEVDVDVEVSFPKENVYRRLADVSPVVHTLARRQFDDYVKRVRIFVHPEVLEEMQRLSDLPQLINQAVQATS